ncbi:UPF0182 family protein [Methylolobus aquaticus]
MRNWKRVLITVFSIATVLAVVVLGTGVALTGFLIDLWWFEALDFGGYFWLRLLYRYILSGGVTVFFFLILFLNFLAASRYLGVDQGTLDDLTDTSEGRRSRRMLALFQTGSLRVFTPLAVMLAIAIAWPFYDDWERALLFFFGPNSGVSDPVFHKDISFYLFELPIFKLIQRELLFAFGIMTLGIAGLYWMEHRITALAARPWSTGARIHLSGLGIITGLILAWGFMLERYTLLHATAHEPVFYGPGFVEIRYYLPLIWVMIVSLIAGVVALVFYLNRGGKGLMVSGVCAMVFAGAWGLRQFDVLPDLINRFVVKPNPVKAEREFMRANIAATLDAYDLTDVETIDVTAATDLWDILDPHIRQTLHNIPVWDPEFLDDVYQQMQGIRPYYHFSDVDAARYQLNGRLEQVNLAAREVNTDRLPAGALTWENLHLRYTHGFGAVITPTAQDGGVPMQWYLRDLNLRSDVGFSIDKPDIYYGLEKLDYAIVPNRLDLVGLSSFDEMSSQNYTGAGGIPISSLFRKLLAAIYLRDEKLFFSVAIDGNSQLLMRRNIVERIRTLTPYLKLDNDPYIIVTPTRMFWIQDAYTISDQYPESKASEFRFGGDTTEQRFNYIRNAVKIVVDAFDGKVEYYIADPRDPHVRAYARAYPGVFKDLNDMPPLLRDQLRYPRDSFAIQMKIFARYHQTEPELFYQQAETMEMAKVQDQIVKPYYLTTYLESCADMNNFVLLSPMTPIGRGNLSVLAIGGAQRNDECGIPYSKNIVIYKFSKDVQVDGPSQVSALIDQDSEVAQAFTLWDQKGSQVIRGRIIILPVGNSILYVQPVYLVSRADTRIPELTRIILSLGNVVVMDTTLERAFSRLETRLKEVAPPGAAAPATTPINHQKRPEQPEMTPIP